MESEIRKRNEGASWLVGLLLTRSAPGLAPIRKPEPAAFLRVGFRQQIWDISRPYSDIFFKNYESGGHSDKAARSWQWAAS
jgi:hypothetical protein